MREIKFRAWIKDKKKMVYGKDATSSAHFTDSFKYIKNEVELMQYTGLHDKNGKEIYEGDIVVFEDMTSTESGYWERDCIGIVVWGEETAAFEVTNRLSAESYEVLSDCEVIGNIYENPELEVSE